MIILALVSFMAVAQGEKKKKRMNRDTLDAIIVPGIAYEPQWIDLMEKRVLWSWILYRNGATRNIIFSGGAVHSPYYECRVMGLMAEKLGVPKERIYYDSLAEHSVENVLYSVALAKRKDFNRIGLATDPVQLFFLKKYLRKRFMSHIEVFKMNRDSLRKYEPTIIQIDATRAMVKNPGDFKALKNRQSFFHRRSHTMGRHISHLNYMKIMYPGRRTMSRRHRLELIKYLKETE